MAAGDPLAAVRAAANLASPPDGTRLLALVSFHRYLGSPEVVQALARRDFPGASSKTTMLGRGR